MAKQFTCSAFTDEAHNNVDFGKILSKNSYSRTFKQPEIILRLEDMSDIPKYKEAIKEGYKDKVPFTMRTVEYTVSYNNLDRVNDGTNRIPALIPTKDNLELLEFTLDNLQQHEVDKYILPVVIDDRSTNPEAIERLANKYGAVHIRVIYESAAFNFSMINNLAAWIFYHAGKKELILWNSDLWVDNKEVVPSLIQKYRDSRKINPSISLAGTKLLYPQQGFCPLVDEDKFISSLAADFNKDISVFREYPPFGTVQFGGSTFSALPYFDNRSTSPILLSPAHYGRFLEQQHPAVNLDRGCSFITGAFQILDLDDFYTLGGLNPSLDISMQDIDYCQRLNKNSKVIYYFGRDKYMIHAESMTLSSKARGKQKDNKKSVHWRVRQFSGEILYAILWNESVILGSLPL